MFDNINNLLFEKRHPTMDNIHGFSPYMVSRYFSFYGDEWVEYCNETVNKYSDVFDDDAEKYEFFHQIIPKLKRKRINYIKRDKNKKEVEDIPVPDFYSKREMEMLTSMSD